jgi:hypothetical protein
MDNQQLVIKMPPPDLQWHRLRKAVITGLFAIKTRDPDTRAAIERAANEYAETLLPFVRESLAPKSLLLWRLKKCSIKKLAELQQIDSAGLSWAVLVQNEVVSDAEPPVDQVIAKSFADAWIPRFSAILHFAMPFTDVPLQNITDGLPDKGIVFRHKAEP